MERCKNCIFIDRGINSKTQRSVLNLNGITMRVVFSMLNE